MRDSVAKKFRPANIEAVRLAAAVLCTLFLYFAAFFGGAYYIQLACFLILLFISRDVLADGFDALGSFEPDTGSFVFVCSLAALMHGLSDWSDRNYFASASLTVLLVLLSEYLETHFYTKAADMIRLSDRVCRVALPVSLIIFVVTVIVSLGMRRGLTAAAVNGFAVLASACQPAVVAAGISAAVVGTVTAAAKGVYVQTSAALEELGKVREIVCEQNGTVTEEKFILHDVYSVDADKTSLLSIAAAVEVHSHHRFASAILAAAGKVGVSIPAAENYFEICGRGVGAVVGGDKYFLGNKKLMRDKKIAIPDAVRDASLGGHIPLYVVKNGSFHGVLLLGSRKIAEAESVMKEIGKLGIRRTLLCDDERADLKNSFDIFLHDREKVLQELKKGAKIKAMVLSRSPIASSDVVCTLSPSENSDVCITDIKGALYAIIIGRRTLGVIKQNLFTAFAFSAIAVMSASGITLSSIPMAAKAALSLAFSIVVVLNSLRLCRFTAPVITSSEDDEMFGKVNYTMKIEGMSCAHCSARVKTALESLRGVSAKISLEEKTARIKCPASTDAETLAKAVADVGFTVISTERV